MYPSRPQTSLVFALPLLTRRVLLCSVLLRVTERLEQASFVIKRDEKLSFISFIVQTDAFKHERNTISVPGLQLVLFCFVFFLFQVTLPFTFLLFKDMRMYKYSLCYENSLFEYFFRNARDQKFLER